MEILDPLLEKNLKKVLIYRQQADYIIDDKYKNDKV